MRGRLAAIGVATMLMVAAPAAANPASTEVAIVVESGARTGEPLDVTITLSDASGDPVSEAPVMVLEELRFFDYHDVSTVGETRTDHRGIATLTYVPGRAGQGRLIAEYPGADELDPATDTAMITVEEGVGVVSPVIPATPDPLLPRGVTAVWFLPLLLAIWLAIATSVYNVLRIPAERGTAHEA